MESRQSSSSDDSDVPPRGHTERHLSIISDERDFVRPNVHAQIDSIPPAPPRDTRYRVHAPRDLTRIDVASLIINKMIGSGIFFGPYAVLVATQNKTIAVVFWILGFIYTMFSMWLYLEYARDLPYTGGELVYLDHTLPRPRLLAYTLYTCYSVFLYNESTNAMKFAQQVLLAANYSDHESGPVDQRLMRFIAFIITSATALLLLFSSAKSRIANSLTAVAKVLCLVAVVIATGVFARKHGSNTHDWYQWGSEQGRDWTSAILIVFFSFFGWDNATLVAGEIPNYNVLRSGFYLGNLVVGVLYIAVTVALCFIFSWDQGPGVSLVQNYFAVIFGNTTTAKVATSILIALSAASNNLSVSYTATRVKQIAGWVNILPFSSIWRKTAPIRVRFPQAPSDVFIIRRGTPQGGIILHWLICVFWICVSAVYRNIEQGISLPADLMVYAHFFVEAGVGIGFALRYDRSQKRGFETPQHGWKALAAPSWLRPRTIWWFLLGSIPAAFSLTVIAWGPVQSSARINLYVVVGIFVAGAAYWFCFLKLPSANSVYRLWGLQISKRQHGDHEIDPFRQCSLCTYYGASQIHRHREDGYLDWNEPEFSSNHMIGQHFVSRGLATDSDSIELELANEAGALDAEQV